MKLSFLTLATVYGQEDELKPPPGKDYVDFGDGEGFMSCTEFFAGNSTFSTFQAEDGLRIGVILYILYNLYSSSKHNTALFAIFLDENPL